MEKIKAFDHGKRIQRHTQYDQWWSVWRFAVLDGDIGEDNHDG